MPERKCNNCVFKDVVGLLIKDGVKSPKIECVQGHNTKLKSPCQDYHDLQHYYETLLTLEGNKTGQTA